VRKALVCILPTVVALGVLARLMSDPLDLGYGYLLKVLAVFVAGAAVVLAGLPRHHPFDSFGVANAVTTARAAVVALLAGLIGERTNGAAAALAVAAAVLVTVLDGVDGWLARRTRMASPFGARFDMETDAVMILVLAVLAWQFGKVGAWVVASGVFRYAFVAAGLVWPSLRMPLPPSTRRKAVAIAQVVALIAALCPFVPAAAAAALAAAGLCALSLSFLQDVRWLLRPTAYSRGGVVSP
jgi:phosphatidylglycerophosphate synthase